jgi:hypothetical protein
MILYTVTDKTIYLTLQHHVSVTLLQHTRAESHKFMTPRTLYGKKIV